MPQRDYIEITQSEFIHSTTIENYLYIIIIYLIAINCIAYIIMWYDKIKSKSKGNRISENTLFILAFMFGAIGIYLGMQAPIKHKSAKLKFRIGIPVLIIFNCISSYLIFKYLK